MRDVDRDERSVSENAVTPSILIDATPLQSEHRTRGVGSYLRHLIAAIERTGVARPWYVASTLGRELVSELLPAERTVFVPRPHAPAQVYWTYNEVALRVALRRLRPQVFLATDFNGLVRNPFGATVAVLYDLTALKLLRHAEPRRALDVSERLSDLRWRTYERKLRRADRILAISHCANYDAASLLGIPEDRIAVAHLAVDPLRHIARTAVRFGTIRIKHAFRPSFGEACIDRSSSPREIG